MKKKMKIFARCLCHSTFVWASPGVKVMGEHGRGMRPVYVGPVVLIANDRPPRFTFGLG